MIKRLSIPVFLCFSILLMASSISHAQNYLKSLGNADKNYNQKIERFDNGEVLIGDSSIEPLRSGGNEGIIYLTRLDNCGNPVWSYSYQISEGYLEFKDFIINEAEEIFVYGSFYQGLEEFIFLLKVDGTSGEKEDFQLWNPGTVDHFSYSIDLKAGQIMLYGLILDFNTQKEGFIAIFNERLAFQWAKKFSPFESTGAAIITDDLGFIGRSGEYLFKLSPDGNLEWATSLSTELDVRPIGGPLKVAGGFILEAYGNGKSFFYKINDKGALLWKSPQIAATDFGAALSTLEDGSVLCTYSNTIGKEGQLYQLTLSPNGQITNQRKLTTAKTINPSAIYQSISDQKVITITSSSNPFLIQETEIKDFVLQFSLDSLPTDCFFWEELTATFPNTLALNFTEYDFLPVPFEMTLVKDIKPVVTPFNLALEEHCGTDIDTDLLKRDTFLPCEIDAWTVELPAPDYRWVDGVTDNPRQLSTPGIYTAKKLSCTDPIEITYQLEKPNCGCAAYLPNAFSPNGDGINDTLAFFTDCELDQLELRIFNRWGELVFYSQQLDYFWDGRYQQQAALAGIYFVLINYQWVDVDKEIHQDVVKQEVTLVY